MRRALGSRCTTSLLLAACAQTNTVDNDVGRAGCKFGAGSSCARCFATIDALIRHTLETALHDVRMNKVLLMGDHQHAAASPHACYRRVVTSCAWMSGLSGHVGIKTIVLATGRRIFL